MSLFRGCRSGQQECHPDKSHTLSGKCEQCWMRTIGNFVYLFFPLSDFAHKLLLNDRLTKTMYFLPNYFFSYPSASSAALQGLPVIGWKVRMECSDWLKGQNGVFWLVNTCLSQHQQPPGRRWSPRRRPWGSRCWRTWRGHWSTWWGTPAISQSEVGICFTRLLLTNQKAVLSSIDSNTTHLGCLWTFARSTVRETTLRKFQSINM